MDLDEIERDGLAGLVVLELERALIVLVGSDISVDRAHHLPGAGDLHVPGMHMDRQPPPGNGKARDHDPAVTVLLRTLLYPDIHEREAGVLRLEPEIDGVLLLRLVLVVEERIANPAIALHATHDFHLLEYEIEIG